MIKEEREVSLDLFDSSLITDMEELIDEFFSLNIDFIDNMMLRSALKKLSGKDILIIQLRILNDYSYFEIGKLLNMRESAVRTRYFRAIQLIRKLMED